MTSSKYVSLTILFTHYSLLEITLLNDGVTQGTGVDTSGF
jgi:hypothetical protein